MGFLTLGRLFDNNLHDQIDDRIDTVSRGLLGLTVACARCHDHKYDAISQADYYCLYGVFASSEEPAELPLVGPDCRDSSRGRVPRKVRREGAGISGARRHAVSRADGGGAPPSRRLPADRRDDASRPERRRRLLHVALTASTAPQIVGRWRRYVARRSSPGDPVFGPWRDLMRPTDADFEQRAPAIARHWLGLARGMAHGQLNPLIADELARTELHSRADVARLYGDAFRKAYAEAKQEAKEPAAAKAGSQVGSDNPARQQLLDILAGPRGPGLVPAEQRLPLYVARREGSVSPSTARTGSRGRQVAGDSASGDGR